MFNKTLFSYIIIFGFVIGIASVMAFSKVIQEGEKTYIVDRHGERWDVSQARSIGFEPERFQYGIGRNAFTPLDDSALSQDSAGISTSQRVIGVSDGNVANAYSVSRLRHHETANSFLGDKPITAAY
jgi:hypothetical protein